MTTTSIPPLPSYPERIITFIDLLGFSRDVLMIETRSGLLHLIHSVLNAIAKCKHDLDAKRASGSLAFDARFTHASDSLIVSYSNDPGACERAIAHAAFLGSMCIRRGFLPRGVITIGRLIHDDAILMGRGLIEAYRIESKEIGEPRIGIAPSILTALKEQLFRKGVSRDLSPYIRNRGSGDFVHILGPNWPYLKKMAEEGDDGIPNMFDEIRQMLPIRYQNADNKKQRRKIEWMTEYVNDSIQEQNLPEDWKVKLPKWPSCWSRIAVLGMLRKQTSQ